jgi:subtilisin family serine protease
VAYVNPDRRVTALHHECGHSGGPPGSGSDACTDGDVSGTVTDADSGDGIGGAAVTLDGDTDYSTTTDSDGTYEITGVDGGDYTATADADGYESESKEITVDGDTTVDFALTASSSDDGSDQVTPWGVERIGAPEAHGEGRTGAGIHTYVLDTGIDADHGDLDVEGGYAVEECKGGHCLADWDDDHGHGTHVAGTAGAFDNSQDVVGVAHKTDLWAVKVLDKRGSG